MNNVLKVRDVVKGYGSKDNYTQVLKGISFDVAQGDFIGIMGASGSGKSTLLNVISTIDNVSSGEIFYSGADITKLASAQIAAFRRDNLGFIFQDFNLLDTLTIEENIGLALAIQKTDPAKISSRVTSIAKELGIGEILTKFPNQVSGGQRQRCACARALINSPQLVLADEPTGALDSASAQVLLETMARINQALKATILMVTHDPFSASYCNRILFLKDGLIIRQIERGGLPRTAFYNEILGLLAAGGGPLAHVD